MEVFDELNFGRKATLLKKTLTERTRGQKFFCIARPVFRAKICRMFFLKILSPVLKNTNKLSPVMSCSKIGHSSFYTGGGVVEKTVNMS